MIDESCHMIGFPAAKRCFAFVYQTDISEAGRVAFISGMAAGPASIAVRAAGAKEAAPIAPNPKADFLRNDLREFRLFVCFMVSLLSTTVSRMIDIFRTLQNHSSGPRSPERGPDECPERRTNF
jgi:hypothetical protein